MVRCGAATGRLGYFLDWWEGHSHESTVKKFPPPLRSTCTGKRIDHLSIHDQACMMQDGKVRGRCGSVHKVL